MTSDNRRHIRRIFVEVADLPDYERGEALFRLCGTDSNLKQEVEVLLQADKRAASPMNKPTIDVGADPAQATPGVSSTSLLETEGRMVDRYRLLKEIGEGGFGTVWLAEQREPVKRRVAFKIIKLGMDTKQVIARFEAERQALAMMDHPNIAKVFDAGATESGRPYFVMEYIDGVPICDYCDNNTLDTKARLDLFMSVCHAIQHAHQKGIIHRDIKPSNVLVSILDGKPVPKVIDFGIAKATSGELSKHTRFTAQKNMVGTPAYMSPEQANMSGIDIDTRSDIYSLGVLLYELLTGTTPFDSNSLAEAGMAEMMRIIREVEPHKPSTRLSSLGDTGTRTAIDRHAGDPRTLSSILKGDLDWIVMKCLEKDRTRRYETANGLAADIKRHLNDEPVSAGAPGSGYRLRKFAKRHRTEVIAGSVVTVALLAGLAGTIWQARAAGVQRDKAQVEATRAIAAEAQTRRKADELQSVADFQGKMLAQVDPTAAGIRLTEDIRTRFDAALAKSTVPDNERAAMVDAFVGQWSRVNATDTALELIDSTILKPAATTIDKQFSNQPAIAATLRHVLAERYHDLGLDNTAFALEEQVLAERRRVLGDDHSDTLDSIGNLGVFQNALGKMSEAEALYREAMDRSRRVRGEDASETLVCISNMGSLLLDKNTPAEAEPFIRESLEKRKRVLGEEHPDTLASLTLFASLLRQQGKLDEAADVGRDALAKRRRVLGEEHPDTLISINEMGVLLQSQGKLDESVAYFREVFDKKQRILGEVHPSTLRSMQSLGALLDASGHPEEAEALMREALAKQQKLCGVDHIDTLVTMGNFSVYLIGRNKFAQAEPLCRETLERRKRVLGDSNAATLIANNVMGLVLIRQGKLAEGEPFWREAVSIAQRVLGPTHPETLIYTHNLAGLAIDQKNPAAAEQLFRQVIDAGSPSVGAGHPTVLSATRRLAALMLEQKRAAEAAEILSKAEPAARVTYIGSSERNLGALLRTLSAARTQLKQFALAETNLLEACAILMKTSGEKHKDTRDCVQFLAECYEAWNTAEPANGRDAKAAEWKTKLEAMKAAAELEKPK